jgi:hypothetical protein
LISIDFQYPFPLAASVLLALFAYCQTAFDVDLGKGKARLALGLLGGFACLAASVSEDMTLYLGGALWMLTDLCGLSPRKDDSHAAA